MVFSVFTRAISWVLGKLDRGYYFLGFGRSGLQFFAAGYGDLEMTLRLVQLKAELGKEMVGTCEVPARAQVFIKSLEDQQATLEAVNNSSELELVTGRSLSPFAEWLPEESKQLEFHVLKPSEGVKIQGVCVMLPHTADQGKTVRRKLYGDDLAKKGVVCIIPIAPYYGVRKPKAQTKWFLREVSDAFLQAVGVAVEAACLLHWAKKTWGADVPLSTAGLSFGGAMAALAAKMYNGPLAVVPYMGCIGPGEPFSEGVLKGSVAWEALQDPHFVNDPRVPPAIVQGGGRADLSFLPPDKRAFCNYCRFVTDTEDFKNALPTSSWGQCVVYSVQARNDDFVPFKESKALHDSLQYLAEGSLEGAGSSTDGSSTAGGAADVQSSELKLISGGHCTGFIQAKRVMPDVVMTALDRLRTKHAM